MKKILVLLIALILITTNVFAASQTGAGSASVTGQDIKKGLSVNLEAAFNMTSDENSKVVFGFTEGDTTPSKMSDEITAIGDVDLATDYNSSTPVAKYDGSGKLAVYYQVQYPKNLTIQLTLPSDLILSTKTAETAAANEKLGWKVDLKDSTYTGTTTSPSYTSASTTALTVCSHTGTDYITCGATKFEIVTDDYSGKTVGSYVGNVVVSLNIGE